MTATKYDGHPLVRFLRHPEIGMAFSVSEWEQLLRAARRGSLLSKVASQAKHSGLLDRLPEKIQNHFNGALRVAESQAISVKWEVIQIQKALAKSDIPFMLLKGAAYIQCRFNAAHGRLLSDVDIMVPRESLEEAEKTLYENGWFSTKLDAYDQRYYREWMHELPPMQHLGRGTSLDVHHTILPPTALMKPDVNKLWERAVTVENGSNVFVLSPVDMVLHSATHLFHEGELEHGLRDLVDIDALIGEFSKDDQFFGALVDRANEQDLGRPLYYALKYCREFLKTSIPESIHARMIVHSNNSRVVRSLMDVVVLKSIGSILDDRLSYKSRISQFCMYVRSHYLRMPIHLLLPHLLRKQLMYKRE